MSKRPYYSIAKHNPGNFLHDLINEKVQWCQHVRAKIVPNLPANTSSSLRDPHDFRQYEFVRLPKVFQLRPLFVVFVHAVGRRCHYQINGISWQFL